MKVIIVGTDDEFPAKLREYLAQANLTIRPVNEVNVLTVEVDPPTLADLTRAMANFHGERRNKWQHVSIGYHKKISNTSAKSRPYSRSSTTRRRS